MKYLVALNLKTRYYRPPIGDFVYSQKHERHIWKSEEIATTARLAEATNEALEFVRRMDQVDLVMGIYSFPFEEAAPEQETPLPADPAKERDVDLFATPTSRKKFRKLTE